MISHHWDWGPQVYVGTKWGVYICGPYLLVILLGFDIRVEELWMVFAIGAFSLGLYVWCSSFGPIHIRNKIIINLSISK